MTWTCSSVGLPPHLHEAATPAHESLYIYIYYIDISFFKREREGISGAVSLVRAVRRLLDICQAIVP